MKTLEQLANDAELSYGLESELVKQQLFDIIKEASIATRVGRELVGLVNLKKGTALDFILADKDSLKFRKVAEGSLIPVDTEAYTKVTVTPDKYGDRIAISTELQEDANWDVIKRNLRQAGREAGLKEDGIIFDALGDSTNGFPSETSHGYTSAGTEVAIADIVGMAKLVRDNDYIPDTLVIHPEQLAELQQIDTFVEADKVGNRETFTNGMVGKIFGMKVITTSTVGASTAYLLDSKESGVLVVRRPLTVKTYEIPDRDSIGVSVTFRAAARCLRPKAGCKLTVS